MKAVCFSLVVMGTVGCVSTVTVRTDDLYRKSGLPRASFELKCPESDLKVTTLSVDKERDYRLLGDQQHGKRKELEVMRADGAGRRTNSGLDAAGEPIYVLCGRDGDVRPCRPGNVNPARPETEQR
jgi:hypothetical protein